MNYTININQAAWSVLFPGAKMKHVIVFDSIRSMCISTSTKLKRTEDGFTWITFNLIMDENPLLWINSKPELTGIIKDLKDFGLIEYKRIERNNYYKLTELSDRLYKTTEEDKGQILKAAASYKRENMQQRKACQREKNKLIADSKKVLLNNNTFENDTGVIKKEHGCSELITPVLLINNGSYNYDYNTSNSFTNKLLKKNDSFKKDDLVIPDKKISFSANAGENKQNPIGFLETESVQPKIVEIVTTENQIKVCPCCKQIKGKTYELDLTGENYQCPVCKKQFDKNLNEIKTAEPMVETIISIDMVDEPQNDKESESEKETQIVNSIDTEKVPEQIEIVHVQTGSGKKTKSKKPDFEKAPDPRVGRILKHFIEHHRLGKDFVVMKNEYGKFGSLIKKLIENFPELNGEAEKTITDRIDNYFSNEFYENTSWDFMSFYNGFSRFSIKPNLNKVKHNGSNQGSNGRVVGSSWHPDWKEVESGNIRPPEIGGSGR